MKKANLKWFFEGKRKYFTLGAIGVVALIAFLTRKSGGAVSASTDSYGYGAAPALDDTVSGGGGSGSILPEDIQEIIDQATDQFSETVTEQQNQYESAITDLNERLNESEMQYQALQAEQDAAMKDALIAEESRVLASLPSDPGLAVYEKAVITQNGQSEAVVKTVSGQTVDYRDANLYGLDNQFKNVVSESDQPIYGYGGADYNKSTTEQKSDMSENIAQLKTDERHRKQEEARTQQVIEAREAIGADTSSQEKYLGQITTYREAATPSPEPAIQPRKEPPRVVGSRTPKPKTFRDVAKERAAKKSS